MVSKKDRRKSSSISSEDSGLGYTVKNKLSSKSVMTSSQQLLQVASLTAQTKVLKRGLMNFSEKVQGFTSKLPSLKKNKLSDLERSQFSPLASSTQQVKRSESTSESSGEDEFSTERTRTVKSNSSSDIEADSSVINEVEIERKPISKSYSNSKSKINIIENQLIPSDFKDEVDSDGLSVVAVNKSVSSYSVSSEIDSDEEPELSSKNKTNKSKTCRPQTSIAIHTKLPKDERGSISSNSEIYQPSLELKSKLNNSCDKVNTNRSDGRIDASNGKSRERTSDPNGKSMRSLQTQAMVSRNVDISPTESDSSEKMSSNESDSYVTIEYKSKHKKLDEANIVLKNFLSENEGYKKLVVPKNADFADLDSDDEVYLLQIPRSINPKIMEGVTFSLFKKSKLKTASGKYIIKRQSNCTSPFLSYSNTLKTMTPLATYKMEKYLKIKGQDEIVVEEKKRQSLPNNIKVRHPLFGSDYESKIELEEQIKEKLNQALQRFNSKVKNPKRKKKIKEEEDKNHLISKILEEKFGNVNESFTEDKLIESVCLGETSKTRGIKTELSKGKRTIDNVKNRRNENISANNDSFENSMGFISRIKTEELDASYSSNISVNETKSKKKKKRKFLSESQELELSNQIEPSLVNLNEIKKEECELEETFIKNDKQFEMGTKEKRKKNANLNIISELVDSQSVNVISSNRKKMKKSCRQKFEVLEEKLENGVDMEVEGKPLTQKRKYKEIDDELPLKKVKKYNEFEVKKEIPNYEDLESYEVPQKKKKKHKYLERTNTELSVKKEPFEEYAAQTPKRKKKSILSSTTIFENLDISDFKVDVSNIDAEEPIVKKKSERRFS